MTKIDVKNDVKFIVSSSFYSYNQHIHTQHIRTCWDNANGCSYMVMVVVAHTEWESLALWGYASNQGDASELPADIQNVFFFNKILTWVFVCLFACFRLLSHSSSLPACVFSLSLSFKVRMRHNLLLMQQQQHTYYFFAAQHQQYWCSFCHFIMPMCTLMHCTWTREREKWTQTTTKNSIIRVINC